MKNRCSVHSKNDAKTTPAINPIANQKKNAIITNSFLSLALYLMSSEMAKIQILFWQISVLRGSSETFPRRCVGSILTAALIKRHERRADGLRQIAQNGRDNFDGVALLRPEIWPRRLVDGAQITRAEF